MYVNEFEILVRDLCIVVIVIGEIDYISCVVDYFLIFVEVIDF